MKCNTPCKKCFGGGEVGGDLGKDPLVAVFAIAPLGNEVLPDIEPLRIATAIGMELGPSELALFDCSLDPLCVDLLLADRRRWVALHRDRERPGLWRSPWGKRRSIHVDI